MSAIVGVRRSEHITGVLPAAEWHLDAATKEEIEDVMETESAA